MAVIAWWWLLTVVVVAFHSASAAVVESTWEVEYKYWWPDCKEGIVMAINGQFPGPTIDAVAGDTVIIHVVNKLSTEGVVIHWHGIRQGLHGGSKIFEIDCPVVHRVTFCSETINGFNEFKISGYSLATSCGQLPQMHNLFSKLRPFLSLSLPSFTAPFWCSADDEDQKLSPESQIIPFRYTT